VIPPAGLPLELIPPVPLPRRPSLDLALVAPRLLRAVRAAAAVLHKTEAGAVIGFGGYVSTPVYLAARRLGLPILIHEQNALPGLANKLAARFTRLVFTSFPKTPLPHARYVGLPMRRGITELDRLSARDGARAHFGLREDLPVLLVSGGSQGALSINAAVLGARDALVAAGIQVLHVLGPKNITTATNAMTDGATGEQARNAAAVVEAGGGILLADADCTAGWVAREVPALIADRARLDGMSAALRGVAKIDAAAVLAEQAWEVLR
jgi:UDP-N-acetylglucosamine--N-acetylmuramyl-(pentapeptide) pyrophosphoryl-undecaprenol N-acetylglucosamine transferase